MSTRSGALAKDNLEAVDFVIAFAIGVLALLGFVALSLARGKQLPAANISDENAKYVKVSIAPVSTVGTMKGDKTSAIPNAWQRKKPPPEALQPPKDETPQPNAVSTSSAAPTDTAKPPPDASAPPTDREDATTAAVDTDAGPLEYDDATTVNNDAEIAVAAESEGGVTSDGSTPGVSEGTGNGLQENQKADYLNKVRGYMIGRFYGACASMPSEAKTDGQNKRHAGAVIVVTGRHIDSSSITRPSGNAAFDGAVQTTLANANAGFPAPPASIADLVVGQAIPLDFVCN